VNLFLVCPEGDAAAAVASVAAELPYFDGAPVEQWRAPSGRAVAAWVAHPPARVGGARYVEPEERRVSLSAGLDPRVGRGVRVTYDDATGDVDLVLDPLGAYPLFAARGAYSNNAEVLRRLVAGSAVDPGVVASLIGGGWSLSGHPLWADVRRVPHERPPLASWFAARDFEAGAAAAAVVDSLRALAGRPGRPDVVPVTGGRDSRVVLGAALRAGLDFRAVTIGGPDAPDVVVARGLCERAGIPHERLAEPPGGTFFSHRDAAERTAILGGGAAVADAPGGIPRDGLAGPLEVWHSGQGGEIARGIYRHAPGADPLYRAFVARRPGRPELLSDEGEQRVRAEIAGFVREMEAAGVPPAEVPDAFYLLQRMSHWAAMGHGVVEGVRDTTSPLWSMPVIPHMLAVPPERRAREAFHRDVLGVLAPELASLPFADRPGWLADQSRWTARRRRAARLAARAAGEARRRVRWTRQPTSAAAPPPVAAGGDPLTALMAELREWVGARPDHPALAVLDRERVLALLERPPATLDFIRHAQVMRLATVVMALERAA
jgi:hypothetical protein